MWLFNFDWVEKDEHKERSMPLRMFRSLFPLIQPRVGASEPSLGSPFNESRDFIGWIIILLVFSVVAIWERSFLCQEHKAEDGFQGLRVVFAIECWCWVNLQAPPVTFFLASELSSVSCHLPILFSLLSPSFPIPLTCGPQLSHCWVMGDASLFSLNLLFCRLEKWPFQQSWTWQWHSYE